MRSPRARGEALPDDLSCGEAIPPEALLGEPLTEASGVELRALTRHLERTDPEAKLIELRALSRGLEAAIIDFDTGAPQRPAYSILPCERLLVVFMDDGMPVVGTMRGDFPSTPHADFVGDEAIPISRRLCLDDRPWQDARGDYNAAGLLRRIAKWFERAGSGRMDDALQFPEPAFRPATTSIIMPAGTGEELRPDDAGPRYLAIIGDGEPKRAEWIEAAPPPDEGRAWVRHLVIALMSRTGGRDGWGWLPTELGQFEAGWGGGGHLYEALRERLAEMKEVLPEDTRAEFFASRPLLCWLNADETRGTQVVALIAAEDTTGALMEKLGLVSRAPGTNDYGSLLCPCEPDVASLKTINLIPANLLYPFNVAFARVLAVRAASARKAVVLGVGAIGSQVVELLTREGAWDEVVLVDDDMLMPHNLARHTLTSGEIGQTKAEAVAQRLRAILGDARVTPVQEKLSASPSPELRRALDEADLVLDLAASPGASRLLVDDPSDSRRACAFFNPAGDAVVVMVEDENRTVDLGVLEAYYLGEVLRRPELTDHLRASAEQVFAGGCRDLTNRMPASRAALLAAAASEALRAMLLSPEAGLQVLSVAASGIAVLDCGTPGTPRRAEVDGWTVRLLGSLEGAMRGAREEMLPRETGSVLLGIVDHGRRRIEVAAVLPPSPDSERATVSFVRGVQGLEAQMNEVGERTAFQLSYVGEWHSHPGGSAAPSETDRTTFARLGREADHEDRPAVMAIVGGEELRLLVGRAG